MKNTYYEIFTILRFRTIKYWLIIFLFAESSASPMNTKFTVVTPNFILFIINMLLVSQVGIICTILTYKTCFTSFKIFRLFSLTYVGAFLMKKIIALFALQLFLDPIFSSHFIHIPKIVSLDAIVI